MRGYGLPRNTDVSSPDVADIHQYGLKTAFGSLTGRAIQKSKSKQAARRIWKRVARREGRNACQ